MHDEPSWLRTAPIFKKESPIGKLPKLQRAKAPKSMKAKADRVILSPAQIAKLMRKKQKQ